MNLYNQNLDYLCEQQNISITEFEKIIYIPKVRIMEPTPNELLKISEYFNLSVDILLKKDLRVRNKEVIKSIQLIVLDVDGTMTDGGMYYTENGDQFKKYNTKDGLAIKRLSKSGMKFGIISHGHKLKVIQDRAELLGIEHIYVGQEDKLSVLNQWCTKLGIRLDQVAYVGDDINDLSVMLAVGFSACPADALNEIKTIASVILTKVGGGGCIREFLDDWF